MGKIYWRPNYELFLINWALTISAFFTSGVLFLERVPRFLEKAQSLLATFTFPILFILIGIMGINFILRRKIKLTENSLKIESFLGKTITIPYSSIKKIDFYRRQVRILHHSGLLIKNISEKSQRKMVNQLLNKQSKLNFPILVSSKD